MSNLDLDKLDAFLAESEAALAQARENALEEAAMACDAKPHYMAEICAAAIRALKGGRDGV
jgi:hypothetical protein